MRHKLTLIMITMFVLIFSLQAQENTKQSQFTAPLDTKLLLSGTFGELRTDHFHSGIDIKTNGKEGEKVYAIADGYISRIKVAGTGFGKALYITHPNGYMSVYAHLKQFTDTIESFVREEQYRRKTFRINIFPEKEQYKVKKGELIALSGNTGGSLGPHLHFEIRDAKTETPVNPLQFGFQVKDIIRPRITSIKVYPESKYSTVDHEQSSKEYKVNGWGLKHRIKDHDTIEVSGDISFGISSFDLLNGAHNKNGVYSIDLFIDTLLVYSHKMDAFSFSESRYLNSMIDYAEFINSNRRFQRTVIDPNNHLRVYGEVYNNGVYQFIDTSFHHLKYIVKDINGNISELNFVLSASPVDTFVIPEKSQEGILFDWQTKNDFINDFLELHAKKGAFYDSFIFTYDTIDHNVDTLFSPIHKLHVETTPVHKWMSLAIKPDTIPLGKEDKLLIVSIDNENVASPAGGEFNDGFIVTSIRSFGNYSIAMDTIPPEIKVLNFKKKKNIDKDDILKFKVTDNCSGITSYKGTLNGEWILIEFDPKNDLMIYKPDHMVKEGENDFKLEVTDDRGNKKVFESIFVLK